MNVQPPFGVSRTHQIQVLDSQSDQVTHSTQDKHTSNV